MFVYRFGDGFVHCVYILRIFSITRAKPSYKGANCLHNLLVQ